MKMPEYMEALSGFSLDYTCVLVVARAAAEEGVKLSRQAAIGWMASNKAVGAGRKPADSTPEDMLLSSMSLSTMKVLGLVRFDGGAVELADVPPSEGIADSVDQFFAKQDLSEAARTIAREMA